MGNSFKIESPSTFQTMREQCATDFVSDFKALANCPSHRILSNKIREFNARSTEKYFVIENKELTINGHTFTVTAAIVPRSILDVVVADSSRFIDDVVILS
jgi:hypothetical protein